MYETSFKNGMEGVKTPELCAEHTINKYSRTAGMLGGGRPAEAAKSRKIKDLDRDN